MTTPSPCPKPSLQKTQELVARISSSLLERFKLLGKSKLASESSSTPGDSSFLQTLQPTDEHYDMINSLLTVELILKELLGEGDWAEKIVLSSYENITHVLENFTLLQRVLQQGKDRSLIGRAFSYSYDHLDGLISGLHSYPVSLANRQRKTAFVDRHISILEEAKDGLLTCAKEQEAPGLSYRQLLLQNKELAAANTELKESLGKAEKELIQLEIKLVNLLNERDYSQNLDAEDLKQELARARMEIDRMDEQFRVQINKYNEVFRSMETEIRSLRQNRPFDDVESLQSEIVRLRSERERDDAIIHDLKERERQLLRQLKTQPRMLPHSSSTHLLSHYPPRGLVRPFKQYQVS